MREIKLGPLAERAALVVGNQYETTIPGIVAQYGLDTTLLYNCLLVALIFKPDPITVDRLRVRAPYTSPKLYAERLSRAAAEGFLRPVDRHGYVLAEKGDQAVKAAVQEIYVCLSLWAPLPPERMARLADLLRRLVEASVAAPEPPAHWCVAHSRNMDPGPGAPVMVRIDQYLSDLAAYRDDAHLASWQDYDVDGPAWDALTCLWRESPLTLDEIYTKIKRRGWEKSDYSIRLEELIQKGWVEQRGEQFTILPPGREVRQAAESLTDEYFYRPWKCLSEKELVELKNLLKNVIECGEIKS